MPTVTPVTGAPKTSIGSHIVALVPHRITVLLACVAACVGILAVPATSASAGDIPAPVLTGPANDPSTTVKDVVLTWDKVSGASAYQVRVSPNNEWTNNEVTLPGKGVTDNTLFEMPVSLPQATYYWEVRAQVGGIWGPYSKPWVFVQDWYKPITILKQPTTADPEIIWAPVKEASLYLLRFQTGNVFEASSIVGEVDCYTNNTSYTPMDYKSDVKPQGGGSPPCTAVGGSGGLQSGKVYSWELIAYDDSTAKQIVADTDPDPSWICPKAQPECDDNVYIDQTGFLYKVPTPGKNTGVVPTSLSTTWHTTSLPGTACNSSAPCPVTPRMSWTAVPGATYYQVHVYRDQDMSNTYGVYETCWPHVTPTNSMFDANAGTSYYWKVEAGVSGSVCTTSTTSNCPTAQQVKNGPTVSNVTLSSGGTTVQPSQTVGVVLTGSNFQPGACVAASAGTVQNTTVNSPTQISFSYTAPQNGASVTFTVINPDGGSAQSTAITVTGGIDVTFFGTSALSSFNKASGTVHLTAPADGSDIHGSSPTFRWTDFQDDGGRGAVEAKNYELQVSRDPDFATTVLDDKSIDLTQYTNPTPLLRSGAYYWRVAPLDESDNVLTWSATRTLTANANGPTVSIVTGSGRNVTHAINIATSEVLQGVSGQTVKVVPDGAPVSAAVRGTLHIGSDPRHYVFVPAHPFATGGTYGLWISPLLADANGNPAQVGGKSIRFTTTATNSSRGWSYHGAWSAVPASGALSHSYVNASAGSSASIVVAGRQAKIFACKGPSMGSITVSVAGSSQTVPENLSYTRCGVELWHHALPVGQHTVTVSVNNGVGNFDELTVT